MAIRTHQSISGFVASDPQLSYTERGDARLYMKIGIEHYRRIKDSRWELQEVEPEQALLLQSLEVSIAWQRVFRNAD